MGIVLRTFGILLLALGCIVTLTTSKAGELAVVWEDFYYLQNSNDKKSKRPKGRSFSCGWRRRYPRCRARVTINDLTGELIDALPHSHSPDRKWCKTHLWRQTLKSKVLENAISGDKAVGETYEEVLSMANSKGEAQFMGTRRGTDRNLRRNVEEIKAFVEARKIFDIDLTGKFGRTLNGEIFVLYDGRAENPPREIIALATNSMLEVMMTRTDYLQVTCCLLLNYICIYAYVTEFRMQTFDLLLLI
jgi:hypothetical protein